MYLSNRHHQPNVLMSTHRTISAFIVIESFSYAAFRSGSFEGFLQAAVDKPLKCRGTSLSCLLYYIELLTAANCDKQNFSKILTQPSCSSFYVHSTEKIYFLVYMHNFYITEDCKHAKHHF